MSLFRLTVAILRINGVGELRTKPEMPHKSILSASQRIWGLQRLRNRLVEVLALRELPRGPIFDPVSVEKPSVNLIEVRELFRMAIIHDCHRN